VTNEAGERVHSPGRLLAQALAADYYQYCPPHDARLLRKG